MLMPSQVIKFLDHEDLAVCEHAFRYLSHAHNPTPATQDDAWRLIDRKGLNSSPLLLADLRRLRWTATALMRLNAAPTQ